MPELQVTIGSEPGKRYSLDDEKNTIMGRHPDCDVVLDSASVSRQHAQIVRIDRDFFVEDMGSRNGTFVNGRAARNRQKLVHGDRLRICDLSFEFSDPQAFSSSDEFTSSGSSRILVDEETVGNPTTITSKLDLSLSGSGLRLSVNPQAKLKAVLEITKNLAGALSAEDVLPKILDSLFKIFLQADRGFIALKTTAAGDLHLKAIKHRHAEKEDTIRISRTIVELAIKGKKAILSADAASDSRFEMSESIVDFRIRSMICAPIVTPEEKVLGVIQIDTLDQRKRFNEDDLDVLGGVALQAGIALENANLHRQTLEQEKVQRDLELARRMQHSLLPSAPPVIKGFHFFDYYHAARVVGGDYYDYIGLPDGRMAIVVADVSGKGIAAALLMAKLSSDVRYCIVSNPQPKDAIRRLNDNLNHAGWDDRFVTMVLAILDPNKNELMIVNAGHMAPLLRDENRNVIDIGEEITGPPLGVAEDYPYEQVIVPIQSGDFVTLYTDGISEAMDPEENFYGTDRLRDQISTPSDSVADLGRHILDDVKNFVGDHPQADDICLACFGRDHDSN